MGFYQWIRKNKPKFNKWNNEIAEKINKIYFAYHQVYGYNMIALLLKQIYGIKISSSVVYRYMKNMKIKVITRGRRHKNKAMIKTTNKYQNILNRNCTAESPKQKWVTDVTYILTNSKTCYLSVVRDLYNGVIIADKLSNKNDKYLVFENFIKAWYQAGKPNNGLLHSDQGVQYNYLEYKFICDKLEITISMSRKGNSI